MFLFAAAYSAVLCTFSNFITVTRNFPISSSFSLAESIFYNHRFRHLTPRDVTRPIIRLDAMQSGQCFAVIDCMASRMSYFILVKWKARHIDRLMRVGLA